jgi:hypothetical protein
VQFISPVIAQKSDGSLLKRATLGGFAVGAGHQSFEGFLGKGCFGASGINEVTVANRVEFRLGGSASGLV